MIPQFERRHSRPELNGSVLINAKVQRLEEQQIAFAWAEEGISVTANQKRRRTIKHLQSVGGWVDAKPDGLGVRSMTRYWTVCGQTATLRCLTGEFANTTCKLCLALSALLSLEFERGCWCNPAFWSTRLVPHQENCTKARQALMKIRGGL